jgi:hypothetical protein
MLGESVHEDVRAPTEELRLKGIAGPLGRKGSSSDLVAHFADGSF